MLFNLILENIFVLYKKKNKRFKKNRIRVNYSMHRCKVLKNWIYL